MQSATPIPTQPAIRKPVVRWKQLSIGCLGIISLMVISLIACALLIPTPGEKQVPAGYTRNESRYLTMRDNTRIAIDIWYPVNLALNQKVPTLIDSTRYGRAYRRGSAFRLMRFFGIDYDLNFDTTPVTRDMLNAAGYVLILVDARGSGASFGSRPIEWSADEVADLGEVIDWIVAQPWSNGKVGALGESYGGNTAELAAANGRPALKAIAPLYDDLDPQFSVVIPGGVLNLNQLQDWNTFTPAMDHSDICSLAKFLAMDCFLFKLLVSSGTKPVDEDHGGRLLAAAQAEHHNANVWESLQGVEHRDDPYGTSGLSLGQVSPYRWRTEIEKSGTAMYIRVGWLDAATVDGALSRYLTFRNPQQVVIGPWNHGGELHTDPFLPADTPTDPTPDQQHQLLIDFFDKQLKDQDAQASARDITYYVQGAGIWKTTTVWPPAGVQTQRWYFGREPSGHGLLSTTAPTGQNDADEYTVDFTANTGANNRWWNEGGRDVIYPDRAEEDKKLLTYTSEPMPTDVEITGSPVVTLYVSSTASDGAFYVYLEDVAPDGRVTYITEGILRALHRKVSAAPPPYTQLGPYQSFLRADASPLTLGKVETVPVTLIATAVRIHQGHRIRISVAGHDASMFRRYPAEGDVTLQVQHNRVYASAVDLPVLAQP